MLSKDEFIKISVEVNLFFQRIIKEHLFFIEVNLKPIANNYIVKARNLKEDFEKLLNETVAYAQGIITNKDINTSDIVTPYTLKVEEMNAKLTGVNINTEITKLELKLLADKGKYTNKIMEHMIEDLNMRTFLKLEEVISFKKEILKESECNNIFISMYDAMLIHDIKEAEHYHEILKNLLEHKMMTKTLCDELNFWNHVMKAHAQFIDGLLDPSLKDLKKVASKYNKCFGKLIKECDKEEKEKIVDDTLSEVESLIKYKKEVIEKALKSNLSSIIDPLLTDHVLREGNHYFKILLSIKRNIE